MSLLFVQVFTIWLKRHEDKLKKYIIRLVRK